MVSKQKSKSTTQVDDLTTKAMLVRFSLHGWSGRKRDGNVEEEVADKHKAAANVGVYIKRILTSPKLKAFWSAGIACNTEHKRLTLPWEAGTGILPAKLYFKYRDTIEPLRTEALKFADEFVEEYTKQWNNGMSDCRESLGDLFSKDDYPDPKYMGAKFDIRLRFRPLENPNDFRVNLGKDATSQVRDELAESLKSDFQELMREPFKRLHEVIQKVHAKLSDSDAIFRDSLIDNVKDLIEVLPDLNITDDPELAKLIAAARKNICTSDVQALRDDGDYRTKVAKSAADILKQMKGVMG